MMKNKKTSSSPHLGCGELFTGLGIYVHIPFCVRKCNYCDFLSFQSDAQLSETYIEALCREIRLFRKVNGHKTADSIFIGGGTPSILEPQLIEKLMKCISCSVDILPECEITIEANPGTLNDEKLVAYKNAGINRVSMGAQSFDEAMLKRLGRIHSESEIYKSFAMLRKHGFNNINIDLMFSLPGQTFDMWKKSVNKVLELRPEHISFYGLSVEQGTPFYEEFQNGRLKLTEDVVDRIMYHYALKRLKEEGYQHYEISNAALPGKESFHNLKYWNMKQYVGFGLGAHSYFKGCRFANSTKMIEYLAQYSDESLIQEMVYPVYYKNTLKDDIEEFMFTGLRKCEGVSRTYFSRLFNKDIDTVFETEINRLKNEGLIEEADEMIRFTAKGRDIANYALEMFIIDED